MTKLCDIPPTHRWVESVRPGFFFGDTDEMRCPDDGVWSDVKALAAWLKRKSSSNDWDCLWIATYGKTWPFVRDEDVFVRGWAPAILISFPSGRDRSREDSAVRPARPAARRGERS